MIRRRAIILFFLYFFVAAGAQMALAENPKTAEDEEIIRMLSFLEQMDMLEDDTYTVLKNFEEVNKDEENEDRQNDT